MLKVTVMDEDPTSDDIVGSGDIDISKSRYSQTEIQCIYTSN
jgi:hypothetical protein